MLDAFRKNRNLTSFGAGFFLYILTRQALLLFYH